MSNTEMSNAEKTQHAMNILAGLCPRVDQVATIAQPIAYVVNLLADVRDWARQQENNPCESTGDGEGNG